MPSWSQPSRESSGPARLIAGLEGAEATELQLMRRRFVEALRRAEIVSILASVSSEEELGVTLAEELCEVYDAEIGVVAELEEGGARVMGLVGVTAESETLLSSSEIAHAAGSPRAVTEEGSNLLGVGARNSLLAGYRSHSGRRIVVGVARIYAQHFDEPEVALLETVTLSAGQALERIRAQADRDRLIAQLKASFLGTAEALANALEAKDDYTADHASAVANLAVEVGRVMGLDGGQLENLRYGAVFHDIGKIAIPDAILHKEGPLDADEREVMMSHPEIGAQIVAPIPFLDHEVKEMVRHDHEHFDGSGYPDGLAREQIPLGSRIILVVDSFHAMTSDRPYREAMPKEEAMAEIARHSGSQFDPAVVSAFMRVVS